jgi:hypothetical protein
MTMSEHTNYHKSNILERIQLSQQKPKKQNAVIPHNYANKNEISMIKSLKKLNRIEPTPL